MTNKFKSIIITLILLMIATITSGGKIQMNNIFQICMTMLMLLGFLKFFVFVLKHIQMICDDFEQIIHNHVNKKYNN